jgi:peptide/nickel transport system permease protein
VYDWTTHLILPWITFALFFLPLYTRMIRARLLETLGEPYVLAARAKGASECGSCAGTC